MVIFKGENERAAGAKKLGYMVILKGENRYERAAGAKFFEVYDHF